MEEVTDGASPARKVRVRRARSTTESLLSIVLALEAFLVFFITLVVYGLDQLDPATAFTGGAVFILLIVLTSGILRYPAGVWFGWVVQAALLATGFLNPVLFFVAAVFVGIWIFCFIRGRQIESQKASFLAAQTESPSTETPKENNA
jgi:hypothetical protein